MDSQTAEPISTSETGRPWWKMCCSGCLLLFIVAVATPFIVFRIFTGPGMQPLSTLPSNYPKDLPLYKIESASVIQYEPGESKGKLMQVVTYPLRWFTGASSTDVTKNAQDVATALQKTDRVIVTWKTLPGSRNDILQYYSDLLKRAGMTDVATPVNDFSLDAVGKRADALMQLHLQNATSTQGVDQLSIIVDYIAK